MKLEHKAYVPVAECGKLALTHLAKFLAVEAYGAAAWLVERAHQLQQRGLSRSAGAYNAYNLALLYAQVHSLEHLKVAETLGKVLYLNHISLITYSAMWQPNAAVK